MPRSVEAARFLRAAVKAGLRMQHAGERGPEGIARLKEIKASVQKTQKRRENRL